ncbi:DUF1304 domain-containing protein [Methylibium sp.]|uniref:DUF1304 domain-containing protein n=1 Tax=Methylibium sp. TaxID=2067992 RepID=UPI003D0ABB02
MSMAAKVVIAAIGVLHVYILVLEMFLWDRPAGMKAFGQSHIQAAATKVMAANQGLYNGFLAVGLFWGLLLGDDGRHVQVFFLACVLVAGLFGAITVGRKPLLIQALPATVGLTLLWLAKMQ